MSDLAARISELKTEKNAIILVHNYQLPEVQDVGDIVGDSFGLAVSASQTDSDVIVFCGVRFMAESAAILNQDKIIIHPEPASLCPMAAMITADSLRELKARYPGVPVVSYVNTTAEVKAESDYCCTSSNAVKVVQSLHESKIIFTPDENLGKYVQRFVPEKGLILWPGYCDTHQNRVMVADLRALKEEHPDADVLVHPECTPEVIDFADFAYSTEGILKHCQSSQKAEFIVGTEREMTYRLRTELPHKKFYPIEKAICPNMKKINLEKVGASMENLAPRVELPRDIIEKAKIPLQRMVDIGRG